MASANHSTELVPDGILVKLNDKSFFVSDRSLATSIGLPMYLAFYSKITSRHETYSPNDFDPAIIKEAQLQVTDLDKSLNILANYPTNSYIKLWRKLKEIHSLIVANISSFNWGDYQTTSADLAKAPCVGQYLENTLNFLSTKEPSHLSTYLLTQFRYLQPLFPDTNINITYGILPASYVVETGKSRQLTETLDSSTSSIWLIFWIIVIGVILVAFLIWATRNGMSA